jgi:hypothetical protein
MKPEEEIEILVKQNSFTVSKIFEENLRRAMRRMHGKYNQKR